MTAITYRREKAGAFITDWRNITPERVKLAAQVGIRYALVHCHENDQEPSDYGHMPKVLNAGQSGCSLGTLKQAGIEPIGFGTMGADGDPVACAEAANGIVYDRGFQVYCANMEFPKGGRPTWDRIFLERWRELQPSLTTWLSSGLLDDRDWEAWMSSGLGKLQSWLPQCYENVNKQATPRNAHFAAVRTDGGHGIPSGIVKPTFGCYTPTLDDGSLGQRYPASAYVRDQLESGLGTDPTQNALGPGFSIWNLGQVSDQELIVFGHAISRGLAKL